MNIQKSVSVVTGANRGVGRALVDALLQAGATRIYATARTDEGLKALGGIDPRVTPLPLEVTDPAQVAALAEEAADATLLINNAAIISFASALEADPGTISKKS